MGVCPNNSRRASVHSDARDAVAGWSVSSGVSFAESRLRRIEVVAVGGEASLARSAGDVVDVDADHDDQHCASDRARQPRCPEGPVVAILEGRGGGRHEGAK